MPATRFEWLTRGGSIGAMGAITGAAGAVVGGCGAATDGALDVVIVGDAAGTFVPFAFAPFASLPPENEKEDDASGDKSRPQKNAPTIRGRHSDQRDVISFREPNPAEPALP